MRFLITQLPTRAARAVAFALASAFAASALADDGPNVVFILADDLGWAQLGAYGSAYYRTPNIDRLADQGMRFTHAYAAAAVCSPTRAALMTGKYPARLHLTDYIPGDRPKGEDFRAPPWQAHLPAEEDTLGELFHNAGYRTGYFGKWHLSAAKAPPESLPLNPDHQGFEETFITYKPTSTPGRPKPWQTPEDDGHNVRVITDKAIDFLDRRHSEPFFLFVSHNTIHDPLMEKAALVEKYASDPQAEQPENHATIAAMIETLDTSVGRILTRIEDLKLQEKTIVVFYSDNGGRDIYATQTPLRAGKGWLYEGGIRVPLIVRWPGHTEPASVSKALVSSQDFFPTFAELLELPIARSIDGESIMPAFRGESIARESLYWHYPHYHGSGMRPGGAMRFGDYKLIEWYEDGALELYDLRSDPGEANDLAPAMPDLIQRLHTDFRVWRQDIGAQMPVPAPAK